MLKDKFRLQIPGTYANSPRVQQAMNRPMVGHRDPDCSRLVRDISFRLAPVFGHEILFCSWLEVEPPLWKPLPSTPCPGGMKPP